MRKIKVIGIGAGHPEHITIQAINAINDTDVLLMALIAWIVMCSGWPAPMPMTLIFRISG